MGVFTMSSSMLAVALLLPLVAGTWQQNDLSAESELWTALDGSTTFKQCSKEAISDCFLSPMADCSQCAMVTLPKHILTKAEDLLALYDLDGDNKITQKEARRVLAKRKSKPSDEVLFAALELDSLSAPEKTLDLKGIVNYVSPDYCEKDLLTPGASGSFVEISSKVNATALVEKTAVVHGKKAKHGAAFPTFSSCDSATNTKCLLCWSEECQSCGVALSAGNVQRNVKRILKRFDNNEDYMIARHEVDRTLHIQRPDKQSENFKEAASLFYYDSDGDDMMSLGELVQMFKRKKEQQEKVHDEKQRLKKHPYAESSFIEKKGTVKKGEVEKKVVEEEKESSKAAAKVVGKHAMLSKYQCPHETIVKCLSEKHGELGEACSVCSLQFSEHLQHVTTSLLDKYDLDEDMSISFAEAKVDAESKLQNGI